MKIAINGFGRIGRMVARAIAERASTDLTIVAINDLGSSRDNAHLFKYDSIHGRFQGEVTFTENSLDFGLGAIKVTAEKNPEKLPWGELGVELALECSGAFTKKEAALSHTRAGAKRVLISAPADGADVTVVYGVNHEAIKPDHKIISNASCTTNCLAPIASVIHKNLGVESGYMTTIHAYTGDQRLVDTLHNDPRRSRAAALSMIPSSTGAAKAVGLVLPELKGKLDGTAVRVPCANVSMVDLKCLVGKNTSPEEVNGFFERAAESNEVLAYVTEPLVSVDFNHSPFSANFDATQTQVVNGRLVRVVAWYDNEWGFANRMVDVAAYLARVTGSV